LNPALPYIAMALLSFLGILASLLLPETLHRSLPESVEEANGIGKDAKFWSYLPYKPTIKCDNGVVVKHQPAEG